MTRIYVLIIGLLTVSFCQEFDGKYTIGGHFSIEIGKEGADDINNSSKTNFTRYEVHPSIGKFISDKMEVGCGYGVRKMEETFNYGTPQSYTSVSKLTYISPYGTFYHRLLDDLYFINHFSFSYGSGDRNLIP